ncbi:hypothetical protein M758_8G087800 [Ceratodon purpureus]|nr:hypothetical protein M758_8G087800 [Ceratodon purpureus]
MGEARGSCSRVAVVATAAVCVAAVSAGAIVYAHHRRQEKLQKQVLWDDKPQKRFKRLLADNSDSPFQHFPSPVTGLREGHPYEDVVRALAEDPKPSFAQHYGDAVMPPGMAGPCVWVQMRSQLEALVEVLKKETEIGVDIEHHHVRSFRGFTSLVQISTYTTDYLLDAIALHDDMHLLHPIFANPAILKIFHGADSDSLWLQRDFHIYIVNLFDTARACDVLGKPQRSLSYLLQLYCGVSTNKIYQRADWRVRPLPAEMEQYARTDAHYLLYIAQRMRTDLIESSKTGDGGSCNGNELLLEVVRRSNAVCLQLYEKEGAGVSSSTAVASILGRFYNNSSSAMRGEEDAFLRKLVQRLVEWRDGLARAEDESLRFVMSDAALLALAKERPLSEELIFTTIIAADELSRSSEIAVPGLPPLPSPSPVVQHHIAELCDMLWDFTQDPKDDVWPWRTNNTADSLYGRICSVLRIPSIWFLPGNNSSSNGEVYITGKDGKPSGTRGQESWVRRTIPKKWRLGNAEQARLQFVKKFACKAPVYHNCRIYAGDGRLLCFCDRKKLEWYIKRGLAEELNEDPPAIRLLFEPKGRPEDENNEFYISRKSNRCVGCGESSHYLRYRIIPSCYRQHFPEHLKSHRSHDIVLLCVDCHEIAHKAAEKHKREIVVKFGVPLFAQRVIDSGSEAAGENEVSFVAEGETGGVSPLQLRTAAMALTRHGPTMPVERRKQLEEILKTYYGGREITPEDLKAALIVGMGPREHRRLLKKKYQRQQRASNPSKNEDIDIMDVKTQGLENSSHITNGDDVHISSDAITSISNQMEDDTPLPPSEADQAEKPEVDQTEKSEVGQVERTSVPDEEQQVGASGSDEDTKLSTLEAEAPRRHSRRSINKESLLGHGPHGKQVVDIIIEKEGDEGIRRFCQVWRAVFVDALQPTFLPPGWDVTHSGRREFGDFSVYNPENQTEHK